MSDNTNNTKRRNRYFKSGLSLMYNGYKYPAAETSILNDDGTTTKRNVGVDANNNYFYVENGQPHIVESLYPMDEVTVTEKKHRPLNYLTMSNDITQVNNLPHRPYNLHLQQRALEGEKQHAQWEKEHPNLSAWSNALAAAPFAVAATPLVIGGAEALGGTALGQSVINRATAAMANPLVNMANNALGIGFAAKGAYDVSQGKFTPETALDLAGGAGLGYKGLLGLNFIKRTEKSNGLIPKKVWEECIRNYKNIINSEDYADRIRRAGLSNNHLDYMRDFTDWSLENPPQRVVKVIDNNPNILGLSVSDPKDPFFGITLKEGLSPEELKSTLIHEIAHFATRNRGDKSPSMIGDIMRANENIADNISWEQKLREYPKDTPIKDINEDLDWYERLVTPQEKRSRAVEIYQHAKDAKMSTDNFIDKFIESNKAPKALKDMRYIMTSDNLKKYVRDFMGIAAPIGVTSTFKQKQYEQ